MPSSLLFLFIILQLPLAGQPPTIKAVFKGPRCAIPYQLFKPGGQANGKSPLIVFLHGSGSRGSDNESQVNALPSMLTDSATRGKYSFLLLAPQCPKNDAWSDFPGFPASLASPVAPTAANETLLLLIDSLQRNEQIDPSRIYVMGFSLGGEGVFDLISRRPELFAAGIPICGVADTSRASAFRNTPLWIFHGDSDQVNDVKYSRIMVDALQKRGIRVKYTEYKGAPHRCWPLVFKEPGLLPWLFAQQR
jgi:predicted peptidase